MKLHKIIGIDPGVSGGIAVMAKTGFSIYKMPITTTLKKKRDKKNGGFKDVKDNKTDILAFNELLKDQSEGLDVMVFIEKVSAWPSDTDDAGKRFMIQKMLKNYDQMIAVITVLGLRYVEVTPQSWQKGLGFTNIGSKKILRKKAYRDYAKKLCPDLKITNETSDALDKNPASLVSLNFFFIISVINVLSTLLIFLFHNKNLLPSYPTVLPE